MEALANKRAKLIRSVILKFYHYLSISSQKKLFIRIEEKVTAVVFCVKTHIHTSIMKSSGSSSNNNGNTIQVALRKRPLQAREIEKGRSAEIVEIVNDKQINLLDADEVNRKYSLEYNVNKNRFKETHFSFDAVFDEEATNNDVYSTIAAPLIKDLLEGINTTFFAYGATGAGKTYT